MIDTHTHLYLDDFDDDRDEAVKRALDADVHKLLLPAVDSQSAERLRQMVARYPRVCYAMAGLHPTSVTHDYQRELQLVEEQLQHPSDYIAVGEIGLDLYWDKTFLAEQQVVLTRQLLLASQCSLPVVLHLRSAKEAATSDDDAYELFFKLWSALPENQRPTGVMHCYSGSVSQALRAVDCGFSIGVGGVVTYKNALLQQVVAALPIESIVVETDSPYLAPVPHRGHRNESAYIPDIINKIAEIKALPAQTIAAQTTQNAQTIFTLP
ncbi:MAG: TatD family hydrolase [Bacteroidales bacterium]|nr:TatD family hydrolase [Bacteroidales bacterium]